MIIQRNQMPLEIPTGHSGRAWTIMKKFIISHLELLGKIDKIMWFKK